MGLLLISAGFVAGLGMVGARDALASWRLLRRGTVTDGVVTFHFEREGGATGPVPCGYVSYRDEQGAERRTQVTVAEKIETVRIVFDPADPRRRGRDLPDVRSDIRLCLTLLVITIALVVAAFVV